VKSNRGLNGFQLKRDDNAMSSGGARVCVCVYACRWVYVYVYVRRCVSIQGLLPPKLQVPGPGGEKDGVSTSLFTPHYHDHLLCTSRLAPLPCTI
jgi:hypothetical protein